MKKILVLCSGNSCRSQIAEAYLRLYSGVHATLWSAGVETHGLNPNAVATMAEDGIDISKQTSNHIDEYRGIDFDYVITVCDHAREVCPWFPTTAKIIHQAFSDPAKATGSAVEIQDAFRKVREEIKDWCRLFVLEHLITSG